MFDFSRGSPLPTRPLASPAILLLFPLAFGSACLVAELEEIDPGNADALESFHVEGSIDSLRDVDVASLSAGSEQASIMILASSIEGRSTIGVAHPERGVLVCPITENEITVDASDVEKFTLSDLDGDDHDDLIAVSRGPLRQRAELRVWKYQRELEAKGHELPYEKESGSWTIPIPKTRRVCDLATGDFNGDGRRDVAVLLDSEGWSLEKDIIIGLNLERSRGAQADYDDVGAQGSDYRFQFRSRVESASSTDEAGARFCSGFVVHRERTSVQISEHGQLNYKDRIVDGLLTPNGSWIYADEGGRPRARDYWNASQLRAHFSRTLAGSRIALGSSKGDGAPTIFALAWGSADKKGRVRAMLTAVENPDDPEADIHYSIKLDSLEEGEQRPPRALAVGSLDDEDEVQAFVGFAGGRIKNYRAQAYDNDLSTLESHSGQGRLVEERSFDLLRTTGYGPGPRDLELVGGLALGDVDNNGETDIVVTSPDSASFSVIYFDPVDY